MNDQERNNNSATNPNYTTFFFPVNFINLSYIISNLGNQGAQQNGQNGNTDQRQESQGQQQENQEQQQQQQQQQQDQQEQRQQPYLVHSMIITFEIPASQVNLPEFQNMDELLNRLFQQAQPRGPPPASKSFIDNLSEFEYNENENNLSNNCVICQEQYSNGEKVTKLPCEHIYHKECISNWLKLHNTCPTCRREFETENPELQSSKQMAGDQSQ